MSAYTEEGFVPAEPATDSRPGRFTATRLRFRQWRRTRPFWGALFALVGGTEILLTEMAPLPVVVHFGPAGLIGFGVPVVIGLCAVLLWFAPQPRAFYAALILLLSLASWITSNLGGFILGMTLGIIGGALALTWSTAPPPRRREPEPESGEAGAAPHEAGGALDQP